MTTDRSRLRSNSTVLGLSAVLAVIAALTFLPAASASGTNVFAGTWSITVNYQGTPVSGTLTLNVVPDATGTSELQGFGGTPCAEPTTYYDGAFNLGIAGTGKVAGCTPSANQLVGRVSAGGSVGDGSITSTSPTTFSGSLPYQGKSYPVTGTLKSTSTPPPSTPPPSTPPTTTPPTTTPTPGGPSSPSSPGGGQSPSSAPSPNGTSPSASAGSPQSKSSTYPAPPGSGVVLAAEPAPGASATVLSPNPLAATPAAVALRVGNSLGDFPGTTIVGPGELQTQATGETLACWLLGPDAAHVPAAAYGKSINLAYFRGRLRAADAYTACAGVGQAIAAASASDPTATASEAHAGGCTAQRLEVAIQVKNGLIAAAQPVGPSAASPTAVRYSCLRNTDGTLKITVSRGRKGGLLATLGPALRFAVVRAPNAATRTATLVFRFGATWTGKWHSTHGAMRLTQAGSRVTGTYAACRGTATIAGVVTGSTFVGTWTEPCDAHGGRLRFTLAPDGQSFAGGWAYGQSAPRMTWKATRTS